MKMFSIPKKSKYFMKMNEKAEIIYEDGLYFAINDDRKILTFSLYSLGVLRLFLIFPFKKTIHFLFFHRIRKKTNQVYRHICFHSLLIERSQTKNSTQVCAMHKISMTTQKLFLLIENIRFFRPYFIFYSKH